VPTYEYRCEECGHVLERLHGMREEPDVECPRCSSKTNRVISGGSGIIFKGSGFYATDYAGDGRTECSEDSPCCGRDERCDTSPCKE